MDWIDYICIGIYALCLLALPVATYMFFKAMEEGTREFNEEISASQERTRRIYESISNK